MSRIPSEIIRDAEKAIMKGTHSGYVVLVGGSYLQCILDKLHGTRMVDWTDTFAHPYVSHFIFTRIKFSEEGWHQLVSELSPAVQLKLL